MQKRKQQPWGRASLSFIKFHGLSSRAILVYLALQSFAGKDNVACPGIDAIANRCDRSPATVKRAIQELKEAGWVESNRRLSRSNEYHIKDYLDEDLNDSDAEFQNEPTEELNSENENNGSESDFNTAQHGDTSDKLNMVSPLIAQHVDPSVSSTW